MKSTRIKVENPQFYSRSLVFLCLGHVNKVFGKNRGTLFVVREHLRQQYIQLDQINMTVLSWYLVKSDDIVPHVLQGSRITRPCITGHPVYIKVLYLAISMTSEVKIFVLSIDTHLNFQNMDIRLLTIWQTLSSNSCIAKKSACQIISCACMNRNLPWSGSRAQKYIVRHGNTVLSLGPIM